MKDAPVIEMTEAEAKVLYQEYADEIKERGDKAEKYLKDLKQTYYHLSQGRKVIDIYEVFKTSGLKDTRRAQPRHRPRRLEESLLPQRSDGSRVFC